MSLFADGMILYILQETLKILSKELLVKLQDRKSVYRNQLEKAMATHSSSLAWKIPWTEEPDRLQSMGSQSQTRLSDVSFKSPAFQLLLPCLQCWFYLLPQKRQHRCGNQSSALSFFRPNWGTHAIPWVHLSFPL